MFNENLAALHAIILIYIFHPLNAISFKNTLIQPVPAKAIAYLTKQETSAKIIIAVSHSTGLSFLLNILIKHSRKFPTNVSHAIANNLPDYLTVVNSLKNSYRALIDTWTSHFKLTHATINVHYYVLPCCTPYIPVKTIYYLSLYISTYRVH